MPQISEFRRAKNGYEKFTISQCYVVFNIFLYEKEFYILYLKSEIKLCTKWLNARYQASKKNILESSASETTHTSN